MNCTKAKSTPTPSSSINVRTNKYNDFYEYSENRIFDVRMKICNRKDQLDRYKVMLKPDSDLSQPNPDGCLFYCGIFDGHTQPSVCDFLVEKLHNKILPLYDSGESSPDTIK